MDLGVIVTSLSVIVAAMALLGVGIVSTRGARDKANVDSMDRTINALKGELDVANGKIDRIDREKAELAQTVTAQGVTIQRQAETIAHLREERPSAQEIAYIRRKLDEHDDRMVQILERWEQDFPQAIAKIVGQRGN